MAITEEVLADKEKEISEINTLIKTLYSEVNSQWNDTSDYRNQLLDLIMKGEEQ